MSTGGRGGRALSRTHRERLAYRIGRDAVLVENYLAAESSLGSAGLDEIRWPHPVRPGDTLRVRATVVESAAR